MAKPKKIDYPPKLIKFLFEQVLLGRGSSYERYRIYAELKALQRAKKVLLVGNRWCKSTLERNYKLITNIATPLDFWQFDKGSWGLHCHAYYLNNFYGDINNPIDTIFKDDDIELHNDWEDCFTREKEEDYIIRNIHGTEKMVFKEEEIENGYKIESFDYGEYEELINDVEKNTDDDYNTSLLNEDGCRMYANDWEWDNFINDFLPSNNIELSGYSTEEMNLLLSGAYKKGADFINFHKIKMRGPNLFISTNPVVFVTLWEYMHNNIFKNHTPISFGVEDCSHEVLLATFGYESIMGNYFSSIFEGKRSVEVKSRALLCYTLNRLKELGYIADNWQSVAERNFTFIGEHGKILTANDLAQSKFNISYSSKNKPKGAELIDEIIDGWCK